MKMFLFMLLLLWNDKESAHAQGRQTYCVDIPYFLNVVADCNRRNERGVVVSKNIKTSYNQRLWSHCNTVKEFIT